MPVHPETLMKLFNPIWKELLQRLARLHAIAMITNIMGTMTADMEDVIINFQFYIEYDGCKKEWTLGTPVSIVRMVMNRK